MNTRGKSVSSSSHGPVPHGGGSSEPDRDRRDLRYFIQQRTMNNGYFDLMALVCTLQYYFRDTNRFVRKVDKKDYGFTMKITDENKEQALKFIQDLEMSPERPIEKCVITFMKTHYNFHVACKNATKREKVVDIFMRTHVLAGLSLKMFVVN
jgi:hypothetical protein